MPPAGVAVSLVAQSAAHRRGRRSSGLAVAALTVAIVFTCGYLAIGLASVAVLFATSSQVAAVADAVVITGPTEIVIGVADADGAAADAGTLEMAAAVLVQRLSSTSTDFVSLAVEGDDIHLVLAVGSSADQLAHARQVVSEPLTTTFAAVLATAAGVAHSAISSVQSDALTPGLLATFAATDCSTSVPDPSIAAGPLVACDSSGTTKYILGAAELTGADFSDAVVSSDTDARSVEFRLNARGTSALTTLTERLVGHEQPGNKLALVSGGTVVTAATVLSALTDSRVTTEVPDDGTAPALADELALGARGIVLTAR